MSSIGGRVERVTGNVGLPFVKENHLLLLKMIGRKVCTRSVLYTECRSCSKIGTSAEELLRLELLSD